MKMAELSDRFYSLVAPDIPNEWDVEEILEPYLNENDSFSHEILSHIPSIWPISNSLCYDFLRLAPQVKDVVTIPQMSQWVCDILDRYEKDGLKATQRFMSETRDATSGSGASNSGLISLSEFESRLLAFLRGVSGKDLLLQPSSAVYTDTETVYLPPELSIFPYKDKNLQLYKLMLAFQWGYIHCGTFTVVPNDERETRGDSPGLWLDTFLNTFESPLLAKDLYFFLETVRVFHFLDRELPGLMRTCARLPWPTMTTAETCSNQAARLTALQNLLLRQALDQHSAPSALKRFLHLLKEEGVHASHSVDTTRKRYEDWSTGADQYEGIRTLLFQGELRLKAVETIRQAKMQRIGQEFIDSLASYLVSMPKDTLAQVLESEIQVREGKCPVESDMTMIMDAEFARTIDEHKAPLLLTINNEHLDLPEDVTQQAKEFFDEFGHLPGRFISSAIGKAGDSMAPDSLVTDHQNEDGRMCAPICYDEWDHRRQGFRKHWCVVNIKELPEVRTGFIASTLYKHKGLITRLRNQFEMIRTTDHFVRGQRDGDDIDLDAMIESTADARAGLPPSDRLFTKLLRDERDISVIFLVDMSNSTVGWVGTTIKESLVLMTEALEILGDRYGIYGFSGMKRTRCELFHIKHLNEPAGEAIRKRIGAISPKEYTRMGPAIRHCTDLLIKNDAKVRLLITITDGKPEDYDDYKGEYAIEDTRHALLEAKTSGIHPFCITIDHHAHDYMDHMYGPVNYIFVNDINKLPVRMPEIYRTLTT